VWHGWLRRQRRHASRERAIGGSDSPLEFGLFLIPEASAPLLATARRAEDLGLDFVGVQDHPYQRRFVDTLSLLAMIASTTSKLRVFPDVANLPLRPPAVLAKSAATIDVLSGGRFELGLGAGAFWDAIGAYGGPRRTGGEALAALAEAIDVIRMMWSGERNLRYEGRHYRLAGAQSGPVPAHAIGIWLGAYGPRALELTARVADGWVPSFRGRLAPIAEMSSRLDDAMSAAGREPGELRRVLNVAGVITDGTTDGPLRGPAEQWADELTELAVDYGFDTFIFWGEGSGQLERFAEEVIPATRAREASGS
jgi:alkanesulfonate monooxygenase SsuD/methylene tetrahydromethanopterin reductase-like flavin-dependent oxidoreductase (luciferase family)